MDTVKKSAEKIVMVSTHRVSCAGGGASGHPKVYMDMGQKDSVSCKYCGRKFVYQS